MEHDLAVEDVEEVHHDLKVVDRVGLHHLLVQKGLRLFQSRATEGLESVERSRLQLAQSSTQQAQMALVVFDGFVGGFLQLLAAHKVEIVVVSLVVILPPFSLWLSSQILHLQVTWKVAAMVDSSTR